MAAHQESSPTLLALFDSLWFEHEILTLEKPATIPTIQEDTKKPMLSRTPTLISRSYSDRCLSSKDSLDSEVPSPKSVLLEHSKLQPILSGKEHMEFSKQDQMKGSRSSGSDVSFKNSKSYKRLRRMDSVRNSKSLSELEFKEVKGFMDLGFVFSDEDRDSSLVSIIPGLQRRPEGKGACESGGIADVSRPYLSEAWDAMEEKRDNQNPLMNWKIPAFGNEMEMKNHLKLWAHTVASNVR